MVNGLSLNRLVQNRPVRVTAPPSSILEIVAKIAAPALVGSHHAPSPKQGLTKSANGSVAVNQRFNGELATTLALTFVAFSWKEEGAKGGRCIRTCASTLEDGKL